ncbi:MAG: DUF4175 family protein [Phaeospirillum sp.]|nr:DUF4175 family protein [Phaeospirillum sp.]
MDDAALLRRLRLARLALWWERLAPALTALAALVALFLALALFDILALLPGWLHALILVGFAAAVSVVLIRLRRTLRPSEAEAARRLERDSGVPHRPLATLADTAALGDPALWQAHRDRMAAVVRDLRPGWPDPVLPARDPYALRFAALLLLVIAAAGGWSDGRDRLSRALYPAVEAPGLGPRLLEVWVIPPSHTGQATQLLRPRSDTPVAVAEGSMVKAVLEGGLGTATLIAGPQSMPFRRDETGAQRIETRIEAGDRLAIEQGWRIVASWPITVIRDALPSIAFTGQPEADPRGRLQASLDASDDYGLAKAWIEIRRLDSAVDEPGLRMELALPGERIKSAALIGRFDLAAHDWAGLPARLIPQAEDGAGQIGGGEPTIVTLPERIFRHPVARALIEWRKEASDAPRLGPEIAERLRLLTADPDLLDGDKRVLLALVLARRVLMGASFDRSELRDLLWQAATRLDDGGLPAAEQELEQARRELENALAENAQPQRLTELVDRVEAALERWMAAMAENGVEVAASPDANVVGEDELAEMLNALRTLAEAGDRDALRRRLAELAAVLAELGQAQAGGGRDDGAAVRSMAALRDIARRQQELLDRSFRRTPPPPEEDEPSRPPAKPSAAEQAEGRRDAQAQKALRDALKQLGTTLAEPPRILDEAAASMAGAAASLGGGDWPLAAEQQGEALRRLKDGAREMVEKMAAARGLGKAGGLAARDPFGRALQGQAHKDDGSTRVQGEAGIRRAREILDELRRRAADPNRPPPELDYLRRLLKQF